MTTDDKFVALQALLSVPSAAAIHRRQPITKNGVWYVSLPGVEVKQGGLLYSPTAGGNTPAAAIDKAWEEHTALNPGEYVVVGAMTSARRAVRWNGRMWQEVEEKKAR